MPLALEHGPLLASAHAGDPEALERLLRVCRPDIRRYAQRHCLISDVDDAVQEALLVLSRRLSSVPPEWPASRAGRGAMPRSS